MSITIIGSPVLIESNMKSGATLLTQSFIYDFTVTGGAFGQQLTGVQIPNQAAIVAVSTYVNVAVVGVSGITLGTVNNIGIFGNATGPFAIGVYNNFFSTGGKGIMDNSLNVMINIAGAPITAGRFQVYMQYYLFQ